MVFNNKVKTGKLIIRKVPAEGENLAGQMFTFTVRFGDVGGQSLGNIIPPKEYTCTVEKHGDEYYGEIVIDKIPVGTRFVVWENEQTGTSLKSVSIEGGKDCAVAADGVKVYGAIAEGEENAVTATFVNTARELIDIAVKKEWKTQDGTTDIPQADLPNAIYLQLQRTETPNVANSWQTVSGYESVELKKPDGYEGCNINISDDETRIADFYKQTIITSVHKVFEQKMYLWPFPTYELKRNVNMTQNPEW